MNGESNLTPVSTTGDYEAEAQLNKMLYFIKPMDRVMLFIDGPNTFYASRACNFDLNYERLYEIFMQRCRVIRATYFTAMPDSNMEYNAIKPLIDWLSYHQYVVEAKGTKQYINNVTGETKIKGNMDVEIAVAFMNALYAEPKMDVAVIFTGDGNFTKLVEAGQQRNTKVIVVSSCKCNPSMVADELRRQADHFIDLVDLSKYTSRTTGTRILDRRSQYASVRRDKRDPAGDGYGSED